MMNTRRAMSTALALVASGVLLTGCGSDPDQPTDTAATSSSSSSTSSTSSSATTPADPNAARAIQTVKGLEATSDKLYTTPSMSNGEFGAYATGDVFKQRSYSLSQARSAGEEWEGKTKVEVLTVTERSDTRQMVVACLDLTRVFATDSSGQPMDLGKRYRQEYTVDKSDGPGQDGKWRVSAEKATTEC